MITSPTLAFVIPLQGRAASRDWVRVSSMAIACLASTLRQRAGVRFHSIVVCNEVPPALPAHAALEIVSIETSTPRDRAERRADKVLKTRVGLERASALGCTHAMVVDADDLVSDRVAEFLAGEPAHAPGWYSPQGYVWKDGSRVAYRRRIRFHERCGTCSIVRLDLQEHMIRDGHYKHAITRFPDGSVLQQLPFPVAVYRVQNGENISATWGPMLRRPERSTIPRLVRLAREYAPTAVNERFCVEFGLRTHGPVREVSVSRSPSAAAILGSRHSSTPA